MPVQAQNQTLVYGIAPFCPQINKTNQVNYFFLLQFLIKFWVVYHPYTWHCP